MNKRDPGWLVGWALALVLNHACSFKDLEYLRAESDEPSSSGGSAAFGASGAGGSTGTGGAGDAHGGSELTQTGGRLTSGGNAANGAPTGGTHTQQGGETASGGAQGGGAQGGHGEQPGNEGGSAGLGEAGTVSTGGTSAGGEITYGIDGQSCAGELSCPDGDGCCRRITVPGGSFNMGTNSDAEAGSDEKPPHATTLATFALDELEVTVARMRRFVEAYDGTPPEPGQGAHPAVSGSGWQLGFTAELPATRSALEDELNCDVGAYQTWTSQAGAREAWPINCVSWYVAFAFCIWDGGRLPTEAEWEMASAGGSEERLYPWGSTAPDLAVHAVANCRGDGAAGCSPADLLAVGSRPAGAGRWGHLDLAGSLWEWTLDHYDATYYQSVGTCTDCANLGALTPRTMRGGNFSSLVTSLRGTGRASKPPGRIEPYVGFRCARSL
jgi:formylglycine-generating enzyme required for sulfatase activity